LESLKAYTGIIIALLKLMTETATNDLPFKVIFPGHSPGKIPSVWSDSFTKTRL